MSQWDLVPFFGSIKGPLTNITSVASYLLVGFIFSQRRAIAALYFPERETAEYFVATAQEARRKKWFSLLPGGLSILTVILFVGYWFTVKSAEIDIVAKYAVSQPSGTTSLYEAAVGLLDKQDRVDVDGTLSAFGLQNSTVRMRFVKGGSENDKDRPILATSVQFQDEETVKAVLAKTPSASIPNVPLAWMLFLLSFLSAVSAFVLMGLKDYLQEVLGRSDKDLILKTVATSKVSFDVDDAAGVIGLMEFCPKTSGFEPIFEGPLCQVHNKLLSPEGQESEGKVSSWCHIVQDNKGTKRETCKGTNVKLTVNELNNKVWSSGDRAFKRQFPAEQIAATQNEPPRASAAHS
jgi:hypothetical protein